MHGADATLGRLRLHGVWRNGNAPDRELGTRRPNEQSLHEYSVGDYDPALGLVDVVLCTLSNMRLGC